MNKPKSTGHESRPRIALPLGREHMPMDYRISLDSYLGRKGFGGGFVENERRIPEHFGIEQSLSGFEETYQNIIDYIVRITHRIWEDPDVEYIGATYSNTSKVYDDYGLQLGNKKIVADTHHTTAAFSNIQLIADEVIWAGNDEIGFHTSHRTIIRGLNDGDSKYGPATGKSVDVLVIANCVALGNEIFLEHVLYNNSSLLQQLGLDLNQTAVKMASSPPAGWPRDAGVWQDLRFATSPSQPLSLSSPVSGFDVDNFVRGNLTQLWNEGDYELLDKNYLENFSFQGPTDRTFTGAIAYKDFLDSLRSAFPDIQLQVDEVYWMGNDNDGYLTSERWSATGTHQGDGLLGPASGCKVQIWGITQHRIKQGRIVQEWMLFNELDLIMQLAAARQ
jgi:predicted ester cyclase